jgi:hypothetical protein
MRFTPQTFGVEHAALQPSTYNLEPLTYNRLRACYQHCADRNHGDPHHQAWR